MGGVDPFQPATVRRTYDVVAEEYDAAFGDDLAQLPFDRQFLDDFAVVGEGGAPVIDVGCGPGQVAAYLADQGIKVIGIDLAPRMLQVAHRCRKVEGIAADFRRLPLRGTSCAGVVAFYSLPFVRRHELLPVLREIRRVTRTGGSLGLATHLGRGEIHGSDEWLGHAVEPIALTLFDEQEIRVALAAASFNIDETRYREPLPHEHQGPRVYVRATAT